MQRTIARRNVRLSVMEVRGGILERMRRAIKGTEMKEESTKDMDICVRVLTFEWRR